MPCQNVSLVYPAWGVGRVLPSRLWLKKGGENMFAHARREHLPYIPWPLRWLLPARSVRAYWEEAERHVDRLPPDLRRAAFQAARHLARRLRRLSREEGRLVALWRRKAREAREAVARLLPWAGDRTAQAVEGAAYALALVGGGNPRPRPRCFHCGEELRPGPGYWQHEGGPLTYTCAWCGWRGSRQARPARCPECGSGLYLRRDHIVWAVIAQVA